MNFKYYKASILIPFILILSLIITPFSSCIESKISQIENLKDIYSYIGTFSTVSILTLILIFINNVLWKYKISKPLIDLPNLNRRYEGTLTSTFLDPPTQQQTQKKCVLEIKQTASSIKIHSYYGDLNSTHETSNSTSVGEEIVKLPNDLFEVFYIFTNDANSLVTQLNNHKGTCSLKYFPDIRTLEGEYYNQRGYKGTIKVSFIQKKTLGRLI